MGRDDTEPVPASGASRRHTAASHDRGRPMAFGGLVSVLAATAILIAGCGGSGRHQNRRLPYKALGNQAQGSSAEATGERAEARHQLHRAAGPPRAERGTGPGVYPVATTSLTLREPAPASIENGRTTSGESIRALPTVLRYPASHSPSDATGKPVPDYASGPFPLVVFSQGFDISAEAYAGLLTAWASAGYVVADPTYPLTDPSAPGGVSEADIVNHPRDLRFVISSLLGGARDRGAVLHDLLDPLRVAVIGHSDGGDVTLAVAAAPCCSDPAVKAAVILSGAELSAFGGSYYHTPSPPLLVVQGAADTVNAPACSAQLYDQAPPPKYYLNILGGEHQPPYLAPGPTRSGIVRAVIDFLNAFLKHQPSGLRGLTHGGLPSGETLTSAPTLAPVPQSVCPGAP